jgi:hypothetical protein
MNTTATTAATSTTAANTNTVNARITAVASLKAAGWNGKSVPTAQQCKTAAEIAETGWEYTDHEARKAVLESVTCHGHCSVAEITSRDYWAVQGGILYGTTCSGRKITCNTTCPLPDMEVSQHGWEHITDEEATAQEAAASAVAAAMPAMVPMTITGASDSDVFCSVLARCSAPWLAEVAKWANLAAKVRREYKGTRLHAAFRRAGIPPEYWS